MERITNQMLRKRLEYYATMVGGHIATSYQDIGGYRIDKNIGGYRIELITNSSGGCMDVSFRGTKRELYDWINAGIETIRQIQKQKDLKGEA